MMKNAVLRRILACVILCALLIQPVFATETEDDISIAQGAHSLDARWSVLGGEQLIINCDSAILYELNSDTMMYSWNADAPVYPASLVKIMTALMVVERGTLSDAITVRQDVLDTVDPNVKSLELQADEVLTVEDLLYAVMVYSANDAAAVLADHIAGSQEQFVTDMNSYAQELGCTGTKFVNVNGLHHSDQVSTARDIAKILAHASKNELFMQFYGATYHAIAKTNKHDATRELSTDNYLLVSQVERYYDGRIIGSRTGATALGDRCVASVAQEGDMKLLCIIMGAESEYEENGNKVTSYCGFPETSKLLDYGFDGYKPVQLLYQGQSLEQCKVQGGANDVVLGVSGDICTVLPEDCGLEDIRFQFSDGYNQIKAPVEKGQIVGSVTLWNGNVCIGSTELYAMSAVGTGSPTVENDDNSPITAGKVILIILAVVVLAFGGVVCVRWIRTIRVVKQKRRRRRSHRRSR